MASTKSGNSSERLLRQLLAAKERQIETLRGQVASQQEILVMQVEQIKATNHHLEEALSQIRMVMDERFFRPTVTNSPIEGGKVLPASAEPSDVEGFDERSDGELLKQQQTLSTDLDREFEQLAAEQGVDWKKEHAG